MDYAIIHKLNNLSENDLYFTLNTIKNILNYKSVTIDNDPNQMINKEGGYLSCIYFDLDFLNGIEIPGEDVIEKGTDGGGCIELYASLKDAQLRCDYLSQFDNTLLYSGSYALVGKAVIRTSYLLTNQQQVSITSQIVNSLINIESFR